MISLTLILVILVAIAAFFIFFKLLRGALKILGIAVFVLLFISMIFGILIYLDVAKLKGSLGKEQTMLLVHNGDVAAGFKYGESDDRVLDSSGLGLFNKDQIADADSMLKSDDFSKLNSTGLIVIVQSGYFYNKSLQVTDDLNITLNEDDVNSLFSCTQLNSCTNILVGAAARSNSESGSADKSFIKNLDSSFSDDLDVRNKAFYNLFAQETLKTKGVFILTGAREGMVQVYPELISLKLIKFVPRSFMKIMPGLNGGLIAAADVENV
jgi:hypothetical protein